MENLINSYLGGSGETAGFAKSCSLATGQPTKNVTLRIKELLIGTSAAVLP